MTRQLPSCETRCAGSEGMADQTSPAIVLIDAQLPSMGGLELRRRAGKSEVKESGVDPTHARPGGHGDGRERDGGQGRRSATEAGGHLGPAGEAQGCGAGAGADCAACAAGRVDEGG